MSSPCSKFRHIVHLCQMLRRWRRKSSARLIPTDVPAGHVAVTVGNSCRRFVVRATYLNHPVFQNLLIRAEEEFGFGNTGPLAIPCDETLFEEILRFLARKDSGSARFVTLEDFQHQNCCHMGFRSQFWAESRPLLNGPSDDKPIW